uniref:Ovule protein n=1 Tax=Romanomermis culicivorax TaxID=13658 RepID=A0A915IQT0_ROMCU
MFFDGTSLIDSSKFLKLSLMPFNIVCHTLSQLFVVTSQKTCNPLLTGKIVFETNNRSSLVVQ